MNYILFLIVAVLFGHMIWRLILKPSTYPEFIPSKIKIVHATILFYIVIMYGWPGFNRLLSVLFRDRLLSSLENKSGGLLIDYVLLINGIGGTALLFLVRHMAKRDRKALNWFFICWPLTFLGSVWVDTLKEIGQIPFPAILIGTTISAIFFCGILAFYLVPKTKVIWL